MFQTLMLHGLRTAETRPQKTPKGVPMQVLDKKNSRVTIYTKPLSIPLFNQYNGRSKLCEDVTEMYFSKK